MITWITPTLRVNDEATMTPDEAFRQISSSLRVSDVPTMNDARIVMHMLKMTDEQINDRIHFALTGEVLHV